ncbi:hypothetical protein EX30DRAFT_82977 [Ascodesmis nigricans]|uniref:Uncharacterized protein n=1 Tax=Ascodesmis nigricans TaxID=341454 RepID=A0A4S2N2S0_9PEZI|nr:hypothetical protein EX30DRAFT_82977 [Ascodesmis nigricans]
MIKFFQPAQALKCASVQALIRPACTAKETKSKKKKKARRQKKKRKRNEDKKNKTRQDKRASQSRATAATTNYRPSTPHHRSSIHSQDSSTWHSTFHLQRSKTVLSCSACSLYQR